MWKWCWLTWMTTRCWSSLTTLAPSPFSTKLPLASWLWPVWNQMSHQIGYKRIVKNSIRIHWWRLEFPAGRWCTAGRSRWSRSIAAGSGFGRLSSCRLLTSDNADWDWELSGSWETIVSGSFPRLPTFQLKRKELCFWMLVNVVNQFHENVEINLLSW